MSELGLPSPDRFKSWDPSQVPVAAIRVHCTMGHDIAEWWHMPNGRRTRWAPGNDGTVRDVGINGYGGPVSDEPSANPYFRTEVECRRLTHQKGIYRVRLTEVTEAALTADLRAMAERGWPAAVELLDQVGGARIIGDHPAGAVAVALELNAFLRRGARGNG